MTPEDRLSRWSGEFAAPAAEQHYRLATYETARRQVRILAVIILLIAWPIILSDHIALAGYPHKWTIFAIRSFVSVTPALWIWAAWKGYSYRAIDRMVMAFVVYIVAETFTLMLIFGGEGFGVMAARNIMFVMVANLLVIMPRNYRVFAHLSSMSLTLFAVFAVSGLSDQTRASLVVLSVSTYLFGFSVGTWLSQMRRREFAKAEELEAANAELRDAHERLEQASQSKSRFVANVSHELRTPLNAIIGFSEVLERELFGPVGHAKYGEYVEDIGRSGRHLLDLINDLLDLNRIESGRSELTPHWLPLHEAAREWLTMVRDMARARGQTLECEEIPRGLDVHVDARALHQIMVNLLTNAVKYAGDGRRIALFIQGGDDGGLSICVSDNGAGMDAATLSRVLNPYERSDHEVAHQTEGWGLGLPLARSLAEASGAELTLESAPAAGTVARLYLPAASVRNSAPFAATQAELAVTRV